VCGITGLINLESDRHIDCAILQSMCDAITHRGPDDEGVYISGDGRVGFGHRRLSIIDLKTGKQPMSNIAEDIWIVFNGEIYNFLELKEELKTKGYCFRTTSDTEVIIYMYEEFGIDGFARLNGIFAFAIYEKKTNSVILARDHFGVKPLYYTTMNGCLMFSSEIKSFMQNPAFKREFDYDAFNSFLTFRYNPSPQTLFRNVKKLSSGHFLRVTTKEAMVEESYWNYTPITNNSISENDVEAFTKCFIEE